MIAYNPKDWFGYLFKFHKADTLRKLLPLMLAISVYTAIIAFLELEYWKLAVNNYVKNIPLMHSLLGFAISMLLVFRTNTAYDRWWEGRKLWGSLVNNSRNLAIKLSALLPANDKNRAFFKKAIPTFAYIMHRHLRREETRLALLDEDEFRNVFNRIDYSRHVPNQIALLMIQRVNELHAEGKITGEQLLFINAELQSFTDICGACERIKNTPIPFSYSLFIKKFIFIYVMTLPFGFVFQLGYWTVPVVAFVFYVLASLEMIAEEIEDPFGGDANDLPTEQIADNIKRHIAELL